MNTPSDFNHLLSFRHRRFEIKKLFAVGFLLIASASGLAGTPDALAQQPSLKTETTADPTVRLDGLVVERKKYHVIVLSENGKVQVNLNGETSVAAKLNRPFFDWASQKVYVVPRSLDASEETLEESQPDDSTARVPLRIPSLPLFLISRFDNQRQLERVMKPRVKRLNYYLLTPDPVTDHAPTDQELFIAGKVELPEDGSQQVTLSVDKRQHAVRLGFRKATMAGFNITDLEPGRTRVMLAGRPSADDPEVLMATTVVFEPVIAEAIDRNGQ